MMNRSSDQNSNLNNPFLNDGNHFVNNNVPELPNNINQQQQQQQQQQQRPPQSAFYEQQKLQTNLNDVQNGFNNLQIQGVKSSPLAASNAPATITPSAYPPMPAGPAPDAFNPFVTTNGSGTRPVLPTPMPSYGGQQVAAVATTAATTPSSNYYGARSQATAMPQQSPGFAAPPPFHPNQATSQFIQQPPVPANIAPPMPPPPPPTQSSTQSQFPQPQPGSLFKNRYPTPATSSVAPSPVSQQPAQIAPTPPQPALRPPLPQQPQQQPGPFLDNLSQYNYQQQQQQQQQYQYQQQQQQYPPMPPQQYHSQSPSDPYAYQQQQQQHQQQQQQQQAARKIDPETLPNPLQVMSYDQQCYEQPFRTRDIGGIPPLATTECIVEDYGNANPKFIRSTMYTVPSTKEISKTAFVPFALVVSPMATLRRDEQPVPVIDCTQSNPIRCVRCKAYMSPNMQFIESGRKFQCAMCKAVSDVPGDYFAHLNHEGHRVDRLERAELVYGTYEFAVGSEYQSRPPKPPAYIFVIEASYNSVQSGLLELLCREMKHILQNLPLDDGFERSSVRVGFITYNKTVHFYNIKETLSRPQMNIVCDIGDVFMPIADGFLVDVEKAASQIDCLMIEIVQMFAQTQETETALLSAIQAGLEALKSNECPGKLFVFHSTLPTTQVPGQLKIREDRKLLLTDKEKTVLVPQTNAYSELGTQCIEHGCSVDLYVTNNSYIDVATIGQVAKVTGGSIYKYTFFNAENDGTVLINDLIINLRKQIAFDAVMRIRTSTGIHPGDFYGHFYMRNMTELEFGSIDCDKAIAVEIEYDDKLPENEPVVIQSALLYTSLNGFRKVRVHNLTLKTTSVVTELFRACEHNTLMNYFAKQAVHRLLENNCKHVTEGLFSRCCQILASYRKHCTTYNTMAQLILPESMKLLPLYVNCLLKNDAISGGPDITVDHKSCLIHEILTMNVFRSISFIYPRLFALHEMEYSTGVAATSAASNNGQSESGSGACKELSCPPLIRCQASKIEDNGLYLLENGLNMFLWIGSGVSQQLLQKVFAVNTFGQLPEKLNSLPELDNDYSHAINDFIFELREEKARYMRLTLVKQGSKMEAVFQMFLMEERIRDNSLNYVDFLCNVHKEIRTILG